MHIYRVPCARRRKSTFKCEELAQTRANHVVQGITTKVANSCRVPESKREQIMLVRLVRCTMNMNFQRNIDPK